MPRKNRMKTILAGEGGCETFKPMLNSDFPRDRGKAWNEFWISRGASRLSSIDSMPTKT